MPLPSGGVDTSRFNVCAPMQRVKLPFVVDYQLSNAGLQTASKAYYPNGIYDVDPSVGSNTVPGFAAWTSLYNTWRVDEVELDCWASNGDAFATQMCVAWLPNDTFVATNSFLRHSYGNQHTEIVMLSAVGGADTHHFRTKMQMSKLYGDIPTYYGSTSNFCGTGASNPTSLFNLIFGATPAHAVPFVNGVYLTIRMNFIVTFFDPANQLDV